MDFNALKKKATEQATSLRAKGESTFSDLKSKVPAGSAPSFASKPASTVSASYSRPPPAPKPAAVSRPAPSVAGPAGFKWSTISYQDKQAFFELLDTYFASRHNSQSALPPPPPFRSTQGQTHDPITSRSTNFSTSSYPPAAQTGSAASDFALFFTEDWRDQWYTQQNSMPPPLRNRKDVLWQASITQLGQDRTLLGVVLFGDLSICNYSVSFNVSRPVPVRKQAQYAPRPQSLAGQQLYEAHIMYGEAIAIFAENAIQGRTPIARGECWDLANEALKSIANYGLPQPVTSISRTHGYLIYEGRAWGKGSHEQAGRWRGGDVAVRRGDIVEWRKVTIREANAQRGSWSTLGDPDHTAIIIEDTAPTLAPADKAELKPSVLGCLTVVEQSAGQLPTRRVYDLAGFEQGEMWIYRPVGMQMYLRCAALSPEWPPRMQMIPAGQ